MTSDEIMHLVNETAPRYQSWGIEAHFQNFAQRLLQIEREQCALVCEQVTAAWSELEYNEGCMDCAKAIRARGET